MYVFVLLHEFFVAHLMYRNDPAPVNKKAKKSSIKQVTAGTASMELDDQAALNRRAQRFQREHEIERQKASASKWGSTGSGSSTPRSGPSNYITFNRLNSSRSGTPSTWDEPENTTFVRAPSLLIFMFLLSGFRMKRIGIVLPSLGLRNSYSKITSG